MPDNSLGFPVYTLEEYIARATARGDWVAAGEAEPDFHEPDRSELRRDPEPVDDEAFIRMPRLER